MRYFFTVLVLALSACHQSDAIDVARGNVLRNRGEREAAIAAYRDAEKKGPNDPVPRMLLGNVFVDLGRFEEARVAYAEAVALEPTATDAMIGLATAYEKLGDTAKAMELLQKVLDLQPDHLYARLSLAELLLRSSSPEEAARQAEAAVAKRPKDPTSLYVLGLALTAKRDYARARDVFDKLESVRPKGAEGPYGRARIAALTGDRETALRELKVAQVRSSSELDMAKDPAFASLGDGPAVSTPTRSP
jgi:cytochrome c-type biogenesis protein CcmH/NrfG